MASNPRHTIEKAKTTKQEKQDNVTPKRKQNRFNIPGLSDRSQRVSGCCPASLPEGLNVRSSLAILSAQSRGFFSSLRVRIATFYNGRRHALPRCQLHFWYPKIRGPQYRPPNTSILIRGTPYKGTLNFKKPETLYTYL